MFPSSLHSNPLQDYVLRVCASIESLRIPFDANAFRESQKEKDARIETVNGERERRLIQYRIYLGTYMHS